LTNIFTDKHINNIWSTYRYEPGDVLVVRPKNIPEEVDEFIKMMDWEEIADKAFKLVSKYEGKLYC
jgi:sulfite reductase alpha subunit-like flavoprotein